MDETDGNNEVVVPVVAEELHADAIPVQTGGVRVTKRIQGHDEIIEQELRKGRVEVKRVKTNRVVDGPQPVQRVGNKLIVPVVAEVLRVKKEWVVTEEIHLIQVEERETVQQHVTVNHEEAQVERLDKEGNAVAAVDPERESAIERERPVTLVGRKNTRSDRVAARTETAASRPRSLLRDRSEEPKKPRN